MKSFRIYSLLLLALMAIAACSNDDDDAVQPAPTSVEGTWEGKYGNGTKVPDWFMGFEIDPNGVIHELNEDGKKIGKGVWTISGDQFLSTYHNDIPYNSNYSLKATFIKSQGTLKGTWGFGNKDTDGGTFELVRKGVTNKR
ncbi:hypothetical protein MUK70_15335 [Dyadobacter chenwenxiniae]|uniref:DUF5640 domain-containing protein n=1 Tax=Dyadobacter chenwenxiniae TaxID=2906456 RepID=A0A9X1PHA1_9BACT|nr:hypothetical protein [Dyadobacter chenwenxiniae]MCF0060616.1 hypothetical protein [Dyadobacter chenwenxiniae]UON80448.1 hypothetical protein MUK70_15335 [Dyadobacter chenwenxiniae]